MLPVKSMVVVLLSLAWATRAAQAPAGCPSETRYASVDATLARFATEQHVPGFVFGIVQNGQLVHCRAAGVQSIADQSPVTVDSVFRIASMTKSFTALAALKLRDAGKLALDEPVAKLVPQWRDLAAANDRAVRVRDLLSHTAGFVTDDPWGDRQLGMADQDFSRLLAAGVARALPSGSRYEYSNFGFALLGRVIGNVSGTRYQDYVQREILQPLGMQSSGWNAGEIPPARRALGYRYEDRAWRPEPVESDGAFASMGGLHTSARDYTRYVSFLLDAWRLDGGADSAVLARSTRRELAQGNGPPRLRAPDSDDPTSCAAALVYGLGMHVATDCRFKIALTHSGGLPGYGSNVLLLPEHGVGLFLFTNRTYAPASVAVRRIAAQLHDERLISARSTPTSPLLQQTRAAVLTMYDARRVDVDGKLLADNFLLDRAASKRNAELRGLREQLGKCDSLTAMVLLAPTPVLQIQTLEFHAN
jgi:D-alanyl-D-alanine-carboxypeptidase/D-alanyl-D-alanine-endopeptidase